MHGREAAQGGAAELHGNCEELTTATWGSFTNDEATHIKGYGDDKNLLEDDGNRHEPKDQHQQLFRDIIGEYRQVDNKEGFLRLEALCQKDRARVLEAIMLLAKSNRDANPRQLQINSQVTRPSHKQDICRVVLIPHEQIHQTSADSILQRNQGWW